MIIALNPCLGLYIKDGGFVDEILGRPCNIVWLKIKFSCPSFKLVHDKLKSLRIFEKLMIICWNT